MKISFKTQILSVCWMTYWFTKYFWLVSMIERINLQKQTDLEIIGLFYITCSIKNCVFVSFFICRQGVSLWLGAVISQMTKCQDNLVVLAAGIRSPLFLEVDLDAFEPPHWWSYFISILFYTSYPSSSPHVRAQTSDHFIHKYYSSTYLWVMCFCKV